MKPVYQTIIDPRKGNCYSAALASILELPLEDVPNFAADNPLSDIDYSNAVDNWLHKRDLARLTITISDKQFPFDYMFWAIPKPYKWCLVSGPSSTFKDSSHCVVGHVKTCAITLVHDPNPSGKFFGGGNPYRASFLVPNIGYKELQELREKEWMLDDLNR